MPKDNDLPGVEGPGVSIPSIKAVDQAFEDLLDARSKRMKFGEKEADCSSVLIQLFHKHNLKKYRYDEKLYTIKQIEKVTIAPKEDNGSED